MCTEVFVKKDFQSCFSNKLKRKPGNYSVAMTRCEYVGDFPKKPVFSLLYPQICGDLFSLKLEKGEMRLSVINL